MADQCIVCLEDLDTPPNLDDADPSLAAAEQHPEGTTVTTTNPSNDSQQQLIAVIKSCGHILHDACLREWTEKANSCPICRTQFNLVEVHQTTRGQ